MPKVEILGHVDPILFICVLTILQMFLSSSTEPSVMRKIFVVELQALANISIACIKTESMIITSDVTLSKLTLSEQTCL